MVCVCLCVCVCVCEFGRVLNLNPVRCVTRGAIHRQSGEYVRAVDELLTAIDKCGEGRVRDGGGCDPVYSAACRQLVRTYNDFAIHCFK